MRDLLIKTYLDYRNNYLTIELFAEHNGLSAVQAAQLIDLARSVLETNHPDQ
jgi:hypothetical protein